MQTKYFSEWADSRIQVTKYVIEENSVTTWCKWKNTPH